jgi:hypothetical protein
VENESQDNDDIVDITEEADDVEEEDGDIAGGESDDNVQRRRR